MVKRTYREDIDWLRAIAVLSVAFFHWDVPPFRGGYIGVDIFFVVSGFLITRIIEADAGRGEFSFAQFYERRVRRLLPALYVMVAIAIVPSFFLFLPAERVDLFKSIIATVTFTSNFYFWSQAGYFGGGANEKPLLHTWSLSVEEQFYLLLPVVILLLFKWHADREGRRKTLLIGLGGLALASFALAEWMMLTDRVEMAFFFSAPRAWEFLLGSLIAIEGIPTSGNIYVRRMTGALGLVLIAVAVLGYRKNTEFPGVSALLPCLGAALFIWSGDGRGSPVRPTFSAANIASFFGKISYSFYLWHWPIYLYWFFYRQHFALGRIEIVVLFIITTIVSWISYRFVEQPLRGRSVISRRSIAFAVATAVSVLLVVGSGVAIQSIDLSVRDPSMQLRAYSPYPSWYRKDVCLVEKWRQFSDRLCLTAEAGKKNILVWGDSSVAQYLHALDVGLNEEGVHILQATAAACTPSLTKLPHETQVCSDLRNRMVEFFVHDKPDLVVISGVWMGDTNTTRFHDAMSATRYVVSFLKERRIPVLIVGPPIQFRDRLPLLLMRSREEHHELTSDEVVQQNHFERDEIIAAQMKEDGTNYVSILQSACPNQVCPLLSKDGSPIVIDHLHLTTEASLIVGRPVAEAIKRILEGKT